LLFDFAYHTKKTLALLFSSHTDLMAGERHFNAADSKAMTMTIPMGLWFMGLKGSTDNDIPQMKWRLFFSFNMMTIVFAPLS
jgi:hypothetical protein